METASELAATIVMARARCRIRNAPHRRPGADDLSEPVSPDAFNVWNVSVAALRRLVLIPRSAALLAHIAAKACPGLDPHCALIVLKVLTFRIDAGLMVSTLLPCILTPRVWTSR